MNCLCRVASAFYFYDSFRWSARGGLPLLQSRDGAVEKEGTSSRTAKSLSRMQGQARPGVHEAKNFAQHVESIAGGSPPVPGIEGIAGGGAYDSPALARNELAPEQANAAGMSFCRDKNHGAVLPSCESRCNDFDFVGGIHDRRFEDVNRLRRHGFVNQNQLVVIILAGERDAHLFQSFAGLRGMSQPDFRRIPFAVEFRRLDGPQRHCAAEHNNCPGFPKRVLHHQPAADAEEDHKGKDQTATTGGEKNTQCTGTRPRSRSGIVRACHLGTGACYPAPVEVVNRRRPDSW